MDVGVRNVMLCLGRAKSLPNIRVSQYLNKSTGSTRGHSLLANRTRFYRCYRIGHSVPNVYVRSLTVVCIR